jgi:hypothetical protein
MIPSDLKPGAKVRCIRSANRWLKEGEVYTVLGGDGPEFVTIVEANPSGGGWYRDRFVVCANADGSDYQGPDDVDLQCDTPTVRERAAQDLASGRAWRNVYNGE